MPYREITTGFSGGVAQDGIVATRTFITDVQDGDITNLPEIGDALTMTDIHDALVGVFPGDDYPLTGVHVVGVDFEPFGDPNNHEFKYTVRYGTQPPEDTTEVESLQFGGEWMTLESAGGGESLKFAYSEDKMTASPKIWIPTATYSVTSFHATMALALTVVGLDSQEHNYSYYLGKVLRTEVGGLPDDGVWLCGAPTIDQIIDRYGVKKFKRTENFFYRIILADPSDSNIAGGGEYCGFNAVWNPMRSMFDQSSPITTYPVTATTTDWPRAMPAGLSV